MFDEPIPPAWLDPTLVAGQAPQAPQAPPAPSGPHERTDSPRGTQIGSRRLFAVAALAAAIGSCFGAGVTALTSTSTTVMAATATSALVSAPIDGSVDGGVIAPIAATNFIGPLAERAAPSIVSIHGTITRTDAFGNVVEGQGAGSGFVLSADGSIVTNNHVVEGATALTVDFFDGTTADATVVATDPLSDLAVLKVNRTGLTPLPIGNSDDLRIGDQLVAIGNALDLSGQLTVTTGIVSATNRSIDEPNGVSLVNLIQTDTAINPGNSGGPLLNMAGEVIGVNTAIAGQAQNIGFAVAITPARRVIDDLNGGQVPVHPLLGVSSKQATNGAPGAEIVEISPGSAAEGAGLKVGDVVLAVDGSAVNSPTELAAAIARHAVGDRIELTIARSDGTVKIVVTLGARPDAQGR